MVTLQQAAPALFGQIAGASDRAAFDQRSQHVQMVCDRRRSARSKACQMPTRSPRPILTRRSNGPSGCARRGMDPMLLDSNGVGGYHVWVLLDKEYPLADVYDFADDLRSDWDKLRPAAKARDHFRRNARSALTICLTRFARRAAITRGIITRGSGILTRIDGENEWLEGGDAIEAMIATRPSKLPKKQRRQKKRQLVAGSGTKESCGHDAKPACCVDLDGVLAQYDRWQGRRSYWRSCSRCLRICKEARKVRRDHDLHLTLCPGRARRARASRPASFA